MSMHEQHAEPRSQADEPGTEPNLRRVIQTLMSTDDYSVLSQGSTEARLVYIHNDPPHPVIRIEMRMP
jgi:hypothetical protein